MRKQELHPRTAVLNKNQKNFSKKARIDALIWLSGRFPLAFDNSVRIRPLKIGIMNDILVYAEEAAKAGISKSKLREAVVLFSRRIDYLACLKAKDVRIDLSGTAVSEVTQEEAEHAAAKIKKRVEKSAKNARKILASKSVMPTNAGHYHESSKSRTSQQSTSAEDHFPIYPMRAASYSAQTTTGAPRAATVVKNKVSRQYDPSAVARLKEKLGISRKLEEEQAMAE